MTFLVTYIFDNEKFTIVIETDKQGSIYEKLRKLDYSDLSSISELLLYLLSITF